MELEENASFKHFLGLVEKDRQDVVKTLVSGRGRMGQPMTNDEYHGFAGEARALNDVLSLVERVKKSKASQEPA
jgi:hypothetical protein